MRRVATTALLAALAVAQIAGDVSGCRALKALAAATGASPAPRVFSAVRGFETYSTRFTIHWRDPSGGDRALELTPGSPARLRGPYNRRNVYGAALAFGPVLATDERARPMLDAVMRRGLCAPYPILRELGIDPADVHGPVTVRYEPRSGSWDSDLPMELEARCP